MLKEMFMIFLMVAVALSVICIIIVVVDLILDHRRKTVLAEGELTDEEYERGYPLNRFKPAFKMEDADGAVYLNAELLPLHKLKEGEPAEGYYCLQDCEHCEYQDDCPHC